MRKLVSVLTSTLLLLMTACGGGSAPDMAGSAVIETITISPAVPIIQIGTSLQLAAIGTYADKSTRDLTRSFQWKSTAPSVATVSAGLVNGIGAGVSGISVDDASRGISAAVNLTVTQTPLGITIIPQQPGFTFPWDSTTNFTCLATFAGGTEVDVTAAASWTIVGNPNGITVSNGIDPAVVSISTPTSGTYQVMATFSEGQTFAATSPLVIQ